MHLILSAILVTDCHLLQLAGNVVGCTTVGVPVGVNPISSGCCSCGLVLVFVVVVVAVPAIRSFMAPLLADLADRLARLGTAVLVCTATTTIVASSVATSTSAVVTCYRNKLTG